mmetsp:Transcript_55356/g.152422  ORF Transcript_55356/g.152422 Transcript_55356/m.152422 type:complete len:956 (-) Transcript_55356:423-3290(-)
MIGGEVNRLLAAYQRRNKLPTQYKIGPDPASIDSCMIGGIVSNNSSGMCCGVAQNTYHTVADMRIMFADGTVLDTSSEESRASFLQTHAHLCEGISAIAQEVQSDEDLVALINKKYSIKCTTGYAINSLVDFPVDDPIEIIKHIIVGSEGTLGFVSQVTFNTVVEHPYKRSAFILFPDMHQGGQATAALRRTFIDDECCVDAVEIFDRKALAEAEKSEDMCRLTPGLVGCPPTSAGLLVECRGSDIEHLERRIEAAKEALRNSGTSCLVNDAWTAQEAAATGEPEQLRARGAHCVPTAFDQFPFQVDPKDSNVFWDMRKGLIPKVGAQRTRGTSMLIEDVACSVESLADMTLDLADMFQRNGYEDASIFGHAMEGNMHLVFSQGFRNADDLEQYSNMMQEMCEIVAEKYNGSLKGEHGTGRNVAPYVEMEWGPKANAIMWKVKKLFDPQNILNPGVLMNEDPDVHRKALKPSPLANDIVDACIECGFCESNCPSRDASLTPRQRITVWREINRLSREIKLPDAEMGPMPRDEVKRRLDELTNDYQYLGMETCAADGMCQEKCPVGINTGALIKALRTEAEAADETTMGKTGRSAANWLAANMTAFDAHVPKVLDIVSGFHTLLGTSTQGTIATLLHKAAPKGTLPLWTPYLPQGQKALPQVEVLYTTAERNKYKDMCTFHEVKERSHSPAPVAAPTPVRDDVKERPKLYKQCREVVYLPSCVTRVMGPAKGDAEQGNVHEHLLSLLKKGGVQKVSYVSEVKSQCCGLMFASRGAGEAAKASIEALEPALLAASDNGRIPILCDTSPCLKHLKDNITDPRLKLSLFEPLDFVHTFLKDNLVFEKKKSSVAVHVPCSSKKMKLEPIFESLVGQCADEVHFSGIPCCGMAGDRGMRYPEISRDGSLQHLDLPDDVTDGYSSSRTCECALSTKADVHFRSVVYLLDECASPAKKDVITK